MTSSKKGFGKQVLVWLVGLAGLVAGLFVVWVLSRQLSVFLPGHEERLRRRDLTRIAEAVLKYEGVSGESDLGIGQVARQIGTCLGGGDSVCNGAEEACLDLSVVLQEALGRVPKDPVGGSLHTSYYSIKKSASGELTVTACNSSAKPLLSVVR